MMTKYFNKMRGDGIAPPAVSLSEIALSGLGSAIAMAVIVLLQNLLFQESSIPLIFAPFGASCVLIFGAIKSPLAQPRNLVGGHVLSALVGVTAYKIFGGDSLLAISVAVGVAIALMHISKTLHAPGGATAMLAVMGGPEIYQLGYYYVLMPCAIGSLVLLLVALVFNNLSPRRQYPQYWI